MFGPIGRLLFSLIFLYQGINILRNGSNFESNKIIY